MFLHSFLNVLLLFYYLVVWVFSVFIFIYFLYKFFFWGGVSIEQCTACYRNVDQNLSFCLKRAVLKFLEEVLPTSISPHKKFTKLYMSGGLLFKSLGLVSREEFKSCLDIFGKCYSSAKVLPDEDFKKAF